jgi:hypothetical protein
LCTAFATKQATLDDFWNSVQQHLEPEVPDVAPGV